MFTFAHRLKWARERKHLTQKDFADMVGISQSGYSKIENGSRQPNLELLVQLPQLLGETADFLLGAEDFSAECMNFYNEIKSIKKKMTELNTTISELGTSDHEIKLREVYLTNLDFSRQLIEINKKRILVELENIPYVRERTLRMVNEL